MDVTEAIWNILDREDMVRQARQTIGSSVKVLLSDGAIIGPFEISWSFAIDPKDRKVKAVGEAEPWKATHRTEAIGYITFSGGKVKDFRSFNTVKILFPKDTLTVRF